MHRQKYSGVMLIDLIWMQKVRSQTCRNIKYIKRAFNFCIVILFLFISVNMHCIYHSFCLHRFPLLVSLSGEELSKSCHSNSALKYLLLPLPLLYLSKLWFQNVAEKRFVLRVQTFAASGTTLVPLLLKDQTLPGLTLLGFAFYSSKGNAQEILLVLFIYLFLSLYQLSGRKQLW